MTIHGGPKVEGMDDCVLYFDPARQQSMSDLGCGGYSGSTDGINDISGQGNHGSFVGDVKMANRTYYTVYSLTYPEGSQTPANRDGITVGYDERGVGVSKAYTRSLNFYVYDHDTNAWVSDSWFNGEREGGNTYDMYSTGWEIEDALFLADYDAIAAAYPNSTFFLGGSHAFNERSTGMVDRFIDCGAPSASIWNWPNVGTRYEFVLIGKPGLGDGNAYGWALENENSAAARLNAGLPHNGGRTLEYDGSTGYLDLNAHVSKLNTYNNGTISIWFKATSGGETYYLMGWGDGSVYWAGIGLGSITGTYDDESLVYSTDDPTGASTLLQMFVREGTGTYIDDEWHQLVVVADGVENTIYIDGEKKSITYRYGDATTADALFNFNSFTEFYIGKRAYTGSALHFDGETGIIQVWNRGLTAREVHHNYNRQKGRYL